MKSSNSNRPENFPFPLGRVHPLKPRTSETPPSLPKNFKFKTPSLPQNGPRLIGKKRELLCDPQRIPSQSDLVQTEILDFVPERHQQQLDIRIGVGIDGELVEFGPGAGAQTPPASPRTPVADDVPTFDTGPDIDYIPQDPEILPVVEVHLEPSGGEALRLGGSASQQSFQPGAVINSVGTPGEGEPVLSQSPAGTRSISKIGVHFSKKGQPIGDSVNGNGNGGGGPPGITESPGSGNTPGSNFPFLGLLFGIGVLLGALFVNLVASILGFGVKPNPKSSRKWQWLGDFFAKYGNWIARLGLLLGLTKVVGKKVVKVVLTLFFLLIFFYCLYKFSVFSSTLAGSKKITLHILNFFSFLGFPLASSKYTQLPPAVVYFLNLWLGFLTSLLVSTFRKEFEMVKFSKGTDYVQKTFLPRLCLFPIYIAILLSLFTNPCETPLIGQLLVVLKDFPPLFFWVVSGMVSSFLCLLEPGTFLFAMLFCSIDGLVSVSVLIAQKSKLGFFLYALKNFVSKFFN